MSRHKNIIAGIILATLFAFTGGEVWTGITVKEYDEAMKKAESFYNSKKKYSIKVTHATYKGHDAQVPYDQSTGYFHFDNGNYHSYLLRIHTIQADKYKVVVDSINKTIIVSDPDSKAAAELMQINYVNSAQYVVAYKSAKTELGTLYKLDFNTTPAYSAYTVTLGDDGQMKDFTVYYRKEYPADAKDPASPKVKPKLKIAYSAFTEVSDFSAGEFDTGKYFTETKKQLNPAPAYAKWKLVDARLPRK